MIEDPPALRLRRDFARPTDAQLAALRGAATGHVVDCMDGQGALHPAVKPLTASGAGFTAVAVTCDCGPADNLGVLGAMDIARPGDAIVAATAGHQRTAVIGDLVAGMMKNAGIAAFVTDGLVRDIEGLEAFGLAVFSKGVTPNSPARNGPASAGYPINLDSVHVCSGDVLVADRDGVVVIPLARVDAVIERLQAVRDAEARLLEQVRGGLTVPPFYTELVRAGRVQEDE